MLPRNRRDPNSNLPNWLSRIRDRARVETSPSNGPSVPGGSEDPDWMKDLQQASSLQSEESDWLDRLQDNSSADLSAPTPEPETSQVENPFSQEDLGSGLDTPDWLRSLSGAEDVHSEEVRGTLPNFDRNDLQPSQPDEDDWMSKLSAWQADANENAAPQPDAGVSLSLVEKPSASAEDEFSWLNSLNPEAGTGSEEPARAENEGFNFPDFLSGLEQPSVSENAPPHAATEGVIQWSGPEEKPDGESSFGGFGLTGFLSNLNDPEMQKPQPAGEYSEDALSGSGTAEFTPEVDLPDWLQDQSVPAQPSNLPSEDSDQPAWLSGQESQAPSEPSSTVETDESVPVEQADETAVPDWLAAFGDETSLDVSSPAETFAVASAAASFTEPVEDVAAQPSAQEAEPAEEAPSWMSDVFEPKFGIEEEGPVSEGFKNENPAEPLSSQPAPDESQPVSIAENAASPNSGFGAEMPDWLREFHDQPVSGTGESVPPLIGGEEALETLSVEGDQAYNVDLPDWLSEDSAEKTAETGEPALSTGDEEIEQADLPEWVKEMRPIESIIPGESHQSSEIDQRVEKAGPLAGILGVLPAEELVTRYRKPSVYSVKLRVTEKQRNQASLFDSILSQEPQPIQIPPARSKVSGTLLRILVAILLLAALTIPQIPWINFAPLAVPVLYPPEMLQMFDRINQTAPDAPVLIAFDYEPGLSGEMRLTSSAVIDQLMAKNTRIVVVSTVPTGPAMAQQLLTEVKSRHADYDLDQQTVNLGYLPGGIISLAEFVQQPQAAATVTLAGGLAWQDTFLKDLNGLGDFSQIIIMTDRAETGRAWVEQVQPRLGKLPMYIVASAQAAPLLSPYVESGQVAGMTSGLLGGVMYARLAGQTDGAANSSLAAYQVGMLLAMVVVLTGAVLYGGMSLFKRDQKDEE